MSACEIPGCLADAGTKVRYGRKVCDYHAANWWTYVLQVAKGRTS
jgi:hypothetical protein